MPNIRCWFYTDDGVPLGAGCKYIGTNCDFVHPSEPLWSSAPPPRNKFQPGGRGRGGGPPFGVPTSPRSRNPTSNGAWPSGSSADAGGWGSPAGTSGGGSSGWGEGSASTWGGGPNGSDRASSTSGTWGTRTGPNKPSNAGGWGDRSGGGGDGWGTQDSGGWGTSKDSNGWETNGDNGGWGAGASTDNGGGWPSGWDGDNSAGGWGNKSSGWGDTSSSGRGASTSGGGGNDTEGGASSARVQVPAVARAVRKKHTSKEKQAQGKAPWDEAADSTWGASGALDGWGESGGGQWEDAGATGWDMDAEANKTTQQPQPTKASPFSFGDAPPLSATAASVSTSVLVPETTRIPAQDKGKTHSVLPPLDTEHASSSRHRSTFHVDSPVDSRSTPQREEPPLNPFSSLLDSPINGRRTSYDFNDPEIGPSRPGSPSPAGSEERGNSKEPSQPSWKDLIRHLYRAVAHQQELNEANAARDRFRRLLKSRRLHDVGDAAHLVLDKAYHEHKSRAEKAERRLKEELHALQEYRLEMDRPATASTSQDGIDGEALKSYAVEVEGWIASMKTYMASWEAQQNAADSPPTREQDRSPSDRKRKRDRSPPGHTDAEAQKTSARLAKLELGVDELRTYFEDLHESFKTAAGKVAQEEYEAAKASDDGEAARPLSPTLVAIHREEMDQAIQTRLLQLAHLRQDTDILKARDRHYWHRQDRMRTEHEDLRAQVMALEQPRPEMGAQIAANTHSINDLSAQLQSLTLRARQPPPLTPTVDELIARMQADLRIAYQEEIMTSLLIMRESVQKHMCEQQETLHSRIWTHMQRDLRIVATVQDFIEEQKTEVQAQAPVQTTTS